VNVPTTIDAGAWLSKYLEGADGDHDLARAMLAAFAEALMSAQASMQCGAAYGERTEERENSRNGYRMRPWCHSPADTVGPRAVTNLLQYAPVLVHRIMPCRPSAEGECRNQR